VSSPKRRPRKPRTLPQKRPGPAGGARDRNRRANLERLDAAALRLFLSRGAAAVTIDDIVAAARMAKGSFYRYARDKSELIDRLLAPVVTEITAVLDRCDDALRRASRDTLLVVYLQLATELSLILTRHADRVLLYLQEARAPTNSAPAVDALGELLQSRAIALTIRAREHQLLRDVDPEVAALTVLGAVDALVLAHLRNRRAAHAIPATIAELVTIVVSGVRR
jgi:AcrR family transcriptional regulator